jgi:hypothetical protein
MCRQGPQQHFDDSLSAASVGWTGLAQNREEWKIASRQFRQKFMSPNLFNGSLGPLSMCANKFADWGRGFRARYPGALRLLIQSDSELVVGLASGRSSPGLDHLPYAEFLKWSSHALALWGFNAAEAGFFVHRPRSDNQVADWMANCAVYRSWLHTFPLLPGSAAPSLLVLASDGACKSNPGPAGAGCALMGFSNGVWSILGSAGHSLGESNSVIAELEAACMCVHVLLLWCVQSRLAISIRDVHR